MLGITMNFDILVRLTP